VSGWVVGDKHWYYGEDGEGEEDLNIGWDK